jgi:pimeloyl-ACP methyl ester carboxylesterase
MPHLNADDGAKLYYEELGGGIPIVFVHEFAGDHRSWELQVRHFSRRYRCIAYNARGYPPSDVPDDGESYSQDRARDDICAVLDALSIETAHVVGLSMAGFAALHFGFTYPTRARSLVVGGCGYGASPDKRAQFAEETEAAARRFEDAGIRYRSRIGWGGHAGHTTAGGNTTSEMRSTIPKTDSRSSSHLAS